MNVLAFLIPVSLILGGVGLIGFFWMLKSEQFEDPDGDAHRILSDEFDKTPKE